MTEERSGPYRAAHQARRPELDVIRVLVVMGLVFFHSALVFDTRDDYYVKNAETTEAVTIIAGFAVVWAMPILFLIGGIGSWYSLRRRGSAGFAAERLRRIGVPLAFATLTLIPIPQWLRQRADPGFDQSYLQFLPQFFDVHLEPAEFPFLVQGEFFETGHLWFVVLLLSFSLLLAPVVSGLPFDRGRRIRERLASLAQRRGMVLVPALPVAIICALLGLEEDFAAWSRWAYLLFFLYGFILASDERFRTAMRRDAALAGVIGVIVFMIGMPGFLIAGGDPFTDMTALAIGARTLYGVAGWCWLVAILGLLDRRHAPAVTEGRPTGGRRLYEYVAVAILPLYVLHQPIVVAVAYGVVGWDTGIAIKYAVIVAASLVLTVAAYDVFVRRTRVTRFLFGMRGHSHLAAGESA